MKSFSYPKNISLIQCSFQGLFFNTLCKSKFVLFILSCKNEYKEKVFLKYLILQPLQYTFALFCYYFTALLLIFLSVFALELNVQLFQHFDVAFSLLTCLPKFDLEEHFFCLFEL